jgi:phytoene dehydrogenase-like protein
MEMERLNGHLYDPEDCLLAIEIPTRHYPALAPKGKHIVVLCTVANYDDFATWGLEAGSYRGSTYRTTKERIAKSLIGRAEKVIPGLSQHIVVKEAATPVTIARYTLNRGGASMGWDQTPEEATKPAQVRLAPPDSKQDSVLCNPHNLTRSGKTPHEANMPLTLTEDNL